MLGIFVRLYMGSNCLAGADLLTCQPPVCTFQVHAVCAITEHQSVLLQRCSLRIEKEFAILVFV